MNKQETILPPLKNMAWRKLKIETEEINHLLTYIPTKNITELNELVYVRAKLVCEKNQGSLKEHEQKSKPGWEIQLETQI